MDSLQHALGEGKSLYEMLDVLPSATNQEIKKAYFKTALQCHPDKCPGDEGAKGRFQALSTVHLVLSDPQRRSLYDETGEVDEGEAGDVDQCQDDWYDYWRTLFPKISVADVESFSDTYKGSEEERTDVLKYYRSGRGKMATIIDSVMLAGEGDEDRFAEIITAAVEGKEVPLYDAFKKRGRRTGSKAAAAKRKAKAEKEAAEADELLAKITGRQRGADGINSLSKKRSNQFSDLISSMEARYGNKDEKGTRLKRGKVKGGKASKASHEDLDDEEFERIQQDMSQKQKSKRR